MLNETTNDNAIEEVNASEVRERISASMRIRLLPNKKKLKII